MSEHTPFLTIFPDCRDMENYAGGLEKAYIREVKISLEEKNMGISAWFSSMPSPAEISALSARIHQVYPVERVTIDADYPIPKSMPVAQQSASGASAPSMPEDKRQNGVPLSPITIDESPKESVREKGEAAESLYAI